MLYDIVLVLHVVVVLCLLILILIQRGRSGGLVEALGGVESIFGTKTSALLVKLTVVLAVLFFATSITSAYLSKQRSKSLFEQQGVGKTISDVPEKAKEEPTVPEKPQEAPESPSPAPQADEGPKTE